MGGQQEVSILLDLKQLKYFIIAYSLLLIPQVLQLILTFIDNNRFEVEVYCLNTVVFAFALCIICNHLLDFMERVYEKEQLMTEDNVTIFSSSEHTSGRAPSHLSLNSSQNQLLNSIVYPQETHFSLHRNGTDSVRGILLEEDTFKGF